MRTKCAEILVPEHPARVIPNYDCRGYQRSYISEGFPRAPKSGLASTESFRVLGRQVDRLAECRTPTTQLMTPDSHVVVQVQNISDTQPLILNPAHPFQVEPERIANGAERSCERSSGVLVGRIEHVPG